MSAFVQKRAQERLERAAAQTCANCSRSGPSVVDLSHLVWVCDNCAGVLRKLGFKVKSIRMSTLSEEELVGLERAPPQIVVNASYLAKYPASARLPTFDSADGATMESFLKAKFVEKRWLDASNLRASMSQPPAPTNANALGWSPMVSSGSRKRLSGTLASKARSSHLSDPSSNLASPSRPAARKTIDREELVAKELRQLEEQEKKSLRRRLTDFYNTHNASRLESMELFVDWISKHGLEAFNAKLVKKYNTGLPKSKKSETRAARARALLSGTADPKGMELEEKRHSRAESVDDWFSEPVGEHDYFGTTATRERAPSTNPFDFM